MTDELSTEHSRRSHAVRCCGIVYYWRYDAKLSENQTVLEIHCKKCKKVHIKQAPQECAPLE